MKKLKLTRRLAAAFTLIRQDSILADIGTDHAYLPIYSILEGRCKKAFASDIGEGPLERARANIALFDVSVSVQTVLTDGAAYFEKVANEFVIAGMGGELIYRIISDAPFLKNGDIHLILQPMTKVPFLRQALAEGGFNIEREILVREDGKIYTIMSVYYDGVKRSLTETEILLGRIEDALNDSNSKLMCDLISSITHDIDNRIYGKRESGQSTESENEIRRKIQEIRRKLNENP